MSISEKQVIEILREEYNKRINHFLEEKITIKDKRGMNLVQDAIGLKVRDKAGFEYTIRSSSYNSSNNFFSVASAFVNNNNTWKSGLNRYQEEDEDNVNNDNEPQLIATKTQTVVRIMLQPVIVMLKQ